MAGFCGIPRILHSCRKGTVEITTERNRTWDPTIGATGAYIDHVSARGYGVTSGANADDSKIDSNDLLEAVFAPDRSTGAISNESSKLAYNLQGEVIYRKARGDAAEHVFTIDDAGQVTSDEVIVHGEANDTLIDEITYTRDARGRVTLVTSHDLDTSSVVNEVEFVFGSFGETTSVKQQNDGEVGDPGTKTTTLSYSYPTAGESTVRLSSTTYPNGQIVTTEYDSGIDAALGRVSGRKYSSSWLFKDKYVGAGRLSERAYGDPISASKWQLSFDRFGRPGELTVGSIVDNTYTYSASGNLTFREDDIANTYGQKTHSEKYTYNGLDYLTKRERGVGGSGSIYNVVESECLTRDPAGNVTARYVGAASSCGATTDFRFNGRSEISEHKPPSESWNPLWAAYSDWGTLIQKGGSSGGGGGAGQGGGAGVSYGGTTNKTDDWNRVVEVAVDGQTVETFEYSGTGWMVEKGSDDLYYDPAGRLLDDGHHWHVWGPTGSNDYVGLGLSAGGFYVYHIQDAVTRDTIVEMFPNGNVYYYFRYDAYGAPTMEDSGRTSTIAVWGDVVLRGGAQYLRSLGYYVGGRGVLSDVLIGAVANGAVVMQVDDTPQDPNDPEHPGYKGGGPEEEEPEDIPRDGTKLTCGLDVTDALIALRDDVKNKYDEQDAGTRYRACVGLYSFSPTLSVTRAWDIMALHFRRQNFFTIAECGRPDPPCGNTVQVTDPTDGTIACFDQAEVNYFLYGIANRICANDSVNRRTVVMELPKSRWLPNGFSATWSYNNHDSQGVLEDLIRFWHKVASNSGDPDCKVAWFRAGYMGWPEDVGMPKPCGDSKFCGKCNRSWPAFRSWVWEPFEERK